MSKIDVKCQCKKCRIIVRMDMKKIKRDGFKCPKCGHDEYLILY